MLDWLLQPITEIIDFLYNGIYDFFVDVFAYFIEIFTIAVLKFMIFAAEFASDISIEILNNIGVSTALNQAWATIPGDTASVLSFFKIPDIISILLNALLTRYVLKFIPFTGK